MHRIALSATHVHVNLVRWGYVGGSSESDSTKVGRTGKSPNVAPPFHDVQLVNHATDPMSRSCNIDRKSLDLQPC